MNPGEARPAWWPILVAFGGPAAIIAVRASPLGIEFFWVVIGVPAVLVAWAAAALWAVGLVVLSARRRAWARLASAATLPLAVLVSAISPGEFVSSCTRLGDVLNFEVLHASYQARVAALPDQGAPKLAVFNRGGMIWSSQGVVYDATDEVALPPERQSPAWKERASRSELACGYSVVPLRDHFYLGYFDC